MRIKVFLLSLSLNTYNHLPYQENAHKKPKLQDSNRHPKTTPTSHKLPWLPSTQGLWLYYICLHECMFFLKTSPITRNMIFKGRKYCKKISLRCPLLFWSHATEHGDVEQVDNIQPAIGKETNIIKPVVVENATKHGDVEEIDNIQPAAGKETHIIKPAIAENADSDLMVYSTRPRLPMQEQDPISLTHNQSSTPESGTSNPSKPSLLNHGFDTDLNIPIAIHKGVRSYIKHPLSNFLSYHRPCHQY